METPEQRYQIETQTFSILREESLMSFIDDCEMKYGVRIERGTPNIRVRKWVHRISGKNNQKVVVLIDEKTIRQIFTKERYD